VGSDQGAQPGRQGRHGRVPDQCAHRPDRSQRQASAAGRSWSGTNFVNGGKQTGYQASLIWLPTDYVKFLAQYTRAHVEGGSAATGTFVSSRSAYPGPSYNVDQFGLRAQLDF
jgi:phosphate-selective porin OprO/OprP